MDEVTVESIMTTLLEINESLKSIALGSVKNFSQIGLQPWHE